LSGAKGALQNLSRPRENMSPYVDGASVARGLFAQSARYLEDAETLTIYDQTWLLARSRYREMVPPMAAASLTLTQMDTGVRYYHQNDERAFFEWLARIPCVESYFGDGSRGLVVQLKRRPGKNHLRELLALGCRYGVDMRQMARFETAKNKDWFCDPEKYWHRAVFGGGSSSP
jgi:hypothetical protein